MGVVASFVTRLWDYFVTEEDQEWWERSEWDGGVWHHQEDEVWGWVPDGSTQEDEMWQWSSHMPNECLVWDGEFWNVVSWGGEETPTIGTNAVQMYKFRCDVEGDA